MDSIIEKLATFSPCRNYRYALWRTWSGASAGFQFVNFICLNPSTADEMKDDNTIRKCIKFARAWGYDGICVTNLFAWRSTDRKAMMKVDDPIGPENDFYIKYTANNAHLVVAAWSQDGKHLGRSQEVLQMLPADRLHYLRMGKSEPWHPLYLPDVSKPILWEKLLENEKA